MTEKELLDLKERVDQAKISVAELTGQLNALMKQLKGDWACSTVEEAEKKLKKLEQTIADLDKKIKDNSEDLKEKYNL